MSKFKNTKIEIKGNINEAKPAVFGALETHLHLYSLLL